jgi:FKBP-type peptidyl-prolyl cis-trans isomerase
MMMLQKLLFSSNRKRKNAESQNNGGGQPDWMRYAVIGFLFYAGVKVYLQQNDTSSPTDPKTSHADSRRSKQDEQIKQQIELIKQQTQLAQQQFLPNGSPAPSNAATPVSATAKPATLPSYIRIGGEIEGQGDAVECGQRATVRVDAQLPDGTALEGYEASATARLTTIGNAKLPWTDGLRGMKLGGVRQLIIPASHAIDDAARKAKNIADTAEIRFKLQLDKVDPVIPANTLSFQAIDLVQGSGESVSCGQRISTKVQVWSEDGTPVSSTPYDVSFAVGSVPYFYGLDRGVVDMKVGGKRRLIVPPAYLQGLQDGSTTPSTAGEIKPLSDIVANKHTVVLDVTLVSVEKAPQ